MLATDPTRGSFSMVIQRASGKEAIRDQMIDLVVSRFKLSEMASVGVRQKFPRLYDLWRGTWTGRFHPHKNNIHIPLMYSAIWADAARKASTSLATYPIVSFLGYGEDDYPTARKWESLIAAQMKDDDCFMKQVDHILTADLYGVSVQQHGWKRKEEFRVIEAIDKLPMSGKLIRSIHRGTIVTFDGPTSEQVDLLDFFPEPNVKSLRDMKWVVRRYFLDLDEVAYMAGQGIFSQAEVNRIKRDGGVNASIASEGATIRRFASRAGMDADTVRFMDKYSRPVEILEFWGTVPSELAADGDQMRVISVANRRYLLRDKPNPFWHRKLPFTSFSATPDPHYFWAPGKGEIIEKLQIVANRYVNQSLDAADLIIDPMWFYSRESNLNTRKLYLRPGLFVPVDGNPATAVAPMQKDLSGLTVADSKLGMAIDQTQRGTGIADDVVAGLQTDGRQTAREFVGRREAAGNRLALEARIYEEMSLEPHANLMVAHDRQFLDTPTMITIIGDNAQFDPVTRMPLNTTRDVMNEPDMMFNYAAKAIGASTALSKSMKQERLTMLLQSLGTPLGQAAMGAINAVNFFRGIFREFEIPNINEIFMPSNPAAGGADLASLVQQATGGRGNISNVPSSGQIVNGAVPIPGMPGVPAGQDMQAEAQMV